MTAAPRTILVMRVLLGETGDSPTAILSIQTISNTIEIKMIKPNIATPGYTAKNNRITPDSKTAIKPKIICNIRSQGGDLIVCNLEIQLLVTYIDDDSTYTYRSELELRDLNAYCSCLCLFIYLYVPTLSVVLMSVNK